MEKTSFKTERIAADETNGFKDNRSSPLGTEAGDMMNNAKPACSCQSLLGPSGATNNGGASFNSLYYTSPKRELWYAFIMQVP